MGFFGNILSLGTALAGGKALLDQGNNMKTFNIPGAGQVQFDLDYSDADEALIGAGFNQLGKASAALDTARGNIQGNLGQFLTNFSQFNPNLNSNFARTADINTDFTQRGGLDGFSERLLAQSDNAARQRLAAQQRGITRQLGAGSPASAVVNAQLAAQSMLNNNPNRLAIASQQVGRNFAEQQAGNQASLASNQLDALLQNLSNQTQLSQSQAQAQNQSLGNQALTQKSGIEGMLANFEQEQLRLLQNQLANI